jgi:TonB family protein
MPEIKKAGPDLPVNKPAEKSPAEKNLKPKKSLPDKDDEKNLKKQEITPPPEEERPEKQQDKAEVKISKTEKMPEPAIEKTESTLNHVEKEQNRDKHIAENLKENKTAGNNETPAARKDPGEVADADQTSVTETTDSSRIEPDPGKSAGNSSEEQAVKDTKLKEKTIQRITAGDVIKRIKPIYPRASRLRREEGTVSILADVSGGKVVSLKIESSSGHKRLDASALDAVRKWEFSFRDEKTIRIPVIFRIDG